MPDRLRITSARWDTRSTQTNSNGMRWTRPERDGLLPLKLGVTFVQVFPPSAEQVPPHAVTVR